VPYSSHQFTHRKEWEKYTEKLGWAKTDEFKWKTNYTPLTISQVSFNSIEILKKYIATKFLLSTKFENVHLISKYAVSLFLITDTCLKLSFQNNRSLKYILLSRVFDLSLRF
jgi:hypothetical protein